VMDYGKWRYEEERKLRQSRRNQVHVSFKEVRLRPKIAVHDYEWKRNQALAFLESGSKVKATVFFRGREREHPERGRVLIERLAADVGEVGKLEGQPVFESRTMTAVFAPL
jgi:translation initiation factor IF-3